MTTDTLLIEKREELKRRLASGEYKTLVDVLLEWIDHALRKTTRRTEPFPLWVVTGILVIVVEVTTYLGIYIAGDWLAVRDVAEFYGLGYGVGFAINVVSAASIITITIVINHYMHKLISLWQNDIIDSTESITNLNNFLKWLQTTCNRRLHLFTTVILSLLFNQYFLYVAKGLFGVHISFGSASSVFAFNIFSMIMFSQLLMVMLLSAMLRNYDLKLFSADPGASKIISYLSADLGVFIYILAVFAVILTLVSSQINILSSLVFVIVLLLWLPITILFILNQTSLASIIRRSKRKTLDEIQAKSEKLRISKSVGTPKTMDAINKLMDFHDRVKATRNSAIDSNTILNFINSLLLPLLAFLLGNLDKVLSLFTRKP